VFFNSWPQSNLSGIRKKKLKNGTSLTGLLQFKKRLTGNPSISYRLVPSFGVFSLTYNDVEPIIFKVKRLARSLYSVTQNGNHFILQCFLGFLKRKFFSCYYIFLYCTELQFHSF